MISSLSNICWIAKALFSIGPISSSPRLINTLCLKPISKQVWPGAWLGLQPCYCYHRRKIGITPIDLNSVIPWQEIPNVPVQYRYLSDSKTLLGIFRSLLERKEIWYWMDGLVWRCSTLDSLAIRKASENSTGACSYTLAWVETVYLTYIKSFSLLK